MSSKYSTEQQSVLLNTIRRLIIVSDEDNRQDEKIKIETQLKETDEDLQISVNENFDKLRSVLETFNSVDEKICASQTKVAGLKNNLRDCKILLRCKKDDLQRLWKEQNEQNKIIEYLEECENVKSIPDKLEKLMKQKYYKTAAGTLVDALHLLKNKLSTIEALKTLQNDLQKIRTELRDIIFDELNYTIYVRSTIYTELLLAPDTQEAKESAKPQHSVSPRKPTIRGHARNRSLTVTLENQVNTPSVKNKKPKEIEKEIMENLDDPNPETNPGKFIGILIEALRILEAVPSGLEVIHSRIMTELRLIIQRTSTEVTDKMRKNGELIPDQNQPFLLRLLLEASFDKFCLIAKAHQVVIERMEIINKRFEIDAHPPLTLYTINFIWDKIEDVLISTLKEYLDNTSVHDNVASSIMLDIEGKDINSFYVVKKKDHASNVRHNLFSLEQSSHALSMAQYVRDNKGTLPSLFESVVDGEQTVPGTSFIHDFLCLPQFRNITSVYKTLENICLSIERCIAESGKNLQSVDRVYKLNDYTNSFVENEFLVRIRDEMMNKVERMSNESQRTIKDERTEGYHREMRTNKPLFKSAVTIDSILTELKHLISDLPFYTHSLLKTANEVLALYAKSCLVFFSDLTLVAPDLVSSDQHTNALSVRWANENEEIQALVRKLPMWTVIHIRGSSPLNKDQVTYADESTAILLQLGSTEVKKSDIMRSVANIRNLGLLQESLEWLSGRIATFISDINIQRSTSEDDRDINTTLHNITEINSNLLRVSDSILITLHLEIRMHCMFYIPSAVIRAGFTTEDEAAIEDTGIKEFNRDLCSLEEQLALQLTDSKLRFLFEGIGHLMATVLIESGMKLNRIDEPCITKISVIVFLLQQNLTNITMSREADLDHAKQFYEILRLNPQQLINAASDREHSFTPKEYEQALALICKAPTYAPQYQNLLIKLRESYDDCRV